MAHLLIIEPGGEQRRFALKRSTTRIGRLGDNDVVVPDGTTSRHEHCRIDLRRDGHYYLRHVQGMNPTLRNGRRVMSPTRLHHRDRIDLGRWALVFLERDESPAYVIAETPAADSDVTVISAGEVLGTRSDPHGEAMDVVLEADRELTVQRPLDDIFRSLLNLARRVVAFDRGVLTLLEGGEPFSPRTAVAVGGAGDRVAVSHEVLKRVATRGEAVLVRDVQGDKVFANRDSIDGLGVHALMCVPLMRDQHVEGVMYLESRRPNGQFNRKTLQVLVHLASVAAAKIETRRLLERVLENRLVLEEVGRAADIQQHLLPHEQPHIDGYEVVGRTLPCLGVGGDWYDWIPESEGGCHFCLGDIAGKGLSAALLMSSAHASLQALIRAQLPPDEVMGRLNALIESRFPYNRFVTLWYALLDPRAHLLTCVNACQERPLVVRTDGRLHRLGNNGTPLGMIANATYDAPVIEVGAGDLIVVYSDGLIDCRNQADEPFGERRLIELVKSTAERTPAEIAESILGLANNHRGDRPHEDDVTLLLLKRLV